MKQMKHWQDPVNVLVGVWLILAPWVLGFTSNRLATGNGIVIGVLLIAAALGAIFAHTAWEEWAEVGIGLWAVFSPWALMFGDVQPARDSTLISGAIVLILALWVLFSDRDWGFMHGHHRVG